jgi:hypothetical protein
MCSVDDKKAKERNCEREKEYYQPHVCCNKEKFFMFSSFYSARNAIFDVEDSFHIKTLFFIHQQIKNDLCLLLLVPFARIL